MHKHTGRFAALAVAGVLATVGLAGGASAAPSATVVPPNSVNKAAIQTGAVDTWKIQDKTIGGWDVLDNTLPLSKMGYDFRQAIAAADVSKADAIKSSTQIKAGAIEESDLNAALQTKVNGQDTHGDLVLTKEFATTTIAKLGGKWFDNKTSVGTFELPAGGPWIIATSVKFTRTANGVAGSRPMVGLRIGQAAPSTWGDDAGSVGGNDIAPLKNADLFGDDTKVIGPLDTPKTVDVDAFGYNDDQGSAGGGEIETTVRVTVTHG